MWAASGQKFGLRIEALKLIRGGRVLFEDVSLDAEAGALIEIRGANGAGKTSLLRAIAGLLKPAAGLIVLNGAADRQLALHLLGHRDGLKSALDARAHVRFWAGLLGGDAAQAEAALARMGLQGEWPARILSQGQARRLALTRLIAAPRPLWLLDEPNAGLDAGGKALLAELIAAHRAAGGIVLAALHEPLSAPASFTLELGAKS